MSAANGHDASAAHQPKQVSQAAQAAVFVQSENPAAMGATKVQGPDFGLPVELQQLLDSYATIGFQATALSRAIGIVEKMVCQIDLLHVGGMLMLICLPCYSSDAGDSLTSLEPLTMIRPIQSDKLQLAILCLGTQAT